LTLSCFSLWIDGLRELVAITSSKQLLVIRCKDHELLLHLLELRISLLELLGKFNGSGNPFSGFEDAIIKHVRYHILPYLEEQAGE